MGERSCHENQSGNEIVTRGKPGVPETREAGNNILKTRTQNNVCLSIYLPINPHQTSKNGYEGKRLKNKNKMEKNRSKTYLEKKNREH